MSNIIQILRRIDVTNQAILLACDDFSSGGTAIDYRRGNQDNQTWGDATGRSKSSTRNNGFLYVTQDGTQTDYNIQADASLLARFDPDKGSATMAVKIASATWTDGTRRNCLWFATDGNMFLRIRKKDTNNTFSIQRRNSAPDSSYINIDGSYSNTNWFRFSATWNVAADIMKLRAAGVNLGTASGLLANTDNADDLRIGNSTGSFEPWKGDFQMCFLHDDNAIANDEMDWLARYNEA